MLIRCAYSSVTKLLDISLLLKRVITDRKKQRNRKKGQSLQQRQKRGIQMKKVFKNAIKVASLVGSKKGLATTGTIVAAGALGLVGLLPHRPEAVVMDNFVSADEIEIVREVKTPSQDDFILADEAEIVQEDIEEETQEEQEVVEEAEVEVEDEVETVEEVEEVQVVDNQDLATERVNEATEATQQATQQVAQQSNPAPQRPQSQPVNNNTGQEEREAEARRAEAARKEEREAEARKEAQKRAKEEAQKRAEEEARKAAEAAKLAEMAKVVADNHNKPNLLLRNGVVVKEGSGRVWYYDGPVDGLSFTDNAGNEIKRNIESITVNESLYDMNGVNYSNYMSGRVAPVVIQTTEVGYVLHVFTR